MSLNVQNGWIMGDSTSTRPNIFNYYKSTPRTYSIADPSWLTWQSAPLWVQGGIAILFVNTTDSNLKLTSIKLKTVSCNSGGQTFIGYNSSLGYYDIGMVASGDAADFTCYVRVCNNSQFNISTTDYSSISNILNSSSSTWEQSDSFTQHISEVNFNMDTRGAVPNGPSAAFGESSSWPENARFIAREYTFSSCPIIQSKVGICTLHFDVTFPTWNYIPGQYYSSSPYVRVYLDPNEMEIIFDEERGPYIWRMTNGKWVLKRPLNIYTSTQWSDIENQ